MFSDILRDLRVKKGISQAQLANAVNVSAGNVSDWERGRSKPGYDALVSLARFFEVSAGRLLELSEIKEGLTCDGIPLSENERDLIAMFRYIGDVDKRTIFDLTTLKYEQATGEKVSVYSTYTATNKQQKDNHAFRDDSSASGIA